MAPSPLPPPAGMWGRRFSHGPGALPLPPSGKDQGVFSHQKEPLLRKVSFPRAWSQIHGDQSQGGWEWDEILQSRRQFHPGNASRSSQAPGYSSSLESPVFPLLPSKRSCDLPANPVGKAVRDGNHPHSPGNSSRDARPAPSPVPPSSGPFSLSPAAGGWLSPCWCPRSRVFPLHFCSLCFWSSCISGKQHTPHPAWGRAVLLDPAGVRR